MNSKDRVLLFDFLAWLAGRLNLKLEYLDLIREYEEARRGRG